MKYEYSKKHKMTYSEMDKNANLSLISAIMLVQDMTTEYFGSFGGDNITVRKKDNAVWVITKTKIHFQKFPKWLDEMEEKSYTIKSKLARTELETTFKDKKGNLFFVAIQESCPIDMTTRKVRRISTITYPADMEEQDSILNKPYLRLNEVFEEKDKKYIQKVLATDIDFSHHTNNVMYVRYLLNAFSSEFWSEKQITDFEIHYIAEVREGAILQIYAKQIDERTIDFLIKEKDKEIVRARISYQK